jgi:hypothetical protein
VLEDGVVVLGRERDLLVVQLAQLLLQLLVQAVVGNVRVFRKIAWRSMWPDWAIVYCRQIKKNIDKAQILEHFRYVLFFTQIGGLHIGLFFHKLTWSSLIDDLNVPKITQYCSLPW